MEPVKITPSRDFVAWASCYTCPHPDFLEKIRAIWRAIASHFDKRFPGAYQQLARTM